MLRGMRYFLVALVLSNVPSARAAQDRWLPTTDKEGSFIISFPGRPQYQQIPNRTYGFTSESYSFYYRNHDLRISFVSLDPQPKTSAESLKALNDSSASYTSGFGKLVRQEKLTDGGRQYENVYSDRSTLMQVRTRLYVRHGNLYTLSCTTDASPGIDEQIAERFFSSFRFLEDLPPRPRTSPRQGIKKGARTTGYSGWYMLKGPNGDFSVELPSRPDYMFSPNQETGIVLHQYLCKFGDNHYAVSYRDVVAEETEVEQIARQSVKSLLGSYPDL